MEASEKLKQTLQSLQSAIEAKKTEAKTLQAKAQDLGQQKATVEQQVRNDLNAIGELEKQAKRLEGEIQTTIAAERMM